MSVREFNLPDPGEGLTEAEIVTWNVKVGDTVKVNDIVVEIETAKSLVELPVPFAGTVTALLVPEGQMVEVGTPIIAVDTCRWRRPPVQDAPAAGAVEPGIEGSPAPKMAAAAAAAEEEEIEEGKIGGTTSTGRTAVLVGYGVKQTEAKRRPRKGAPPSHRESATSVAPAVQRRRARRDGPAARCPPPGWPARVAPARWPSRRSASTPRTSASTSSAVAGSGEGGIISRADIDAHAGQLPPSASPRSPRTAAREPARRHTWHRCSAAAGSARRASRSRGSAR